MCDIQAAPPLPDGKPSFPPPAAAARLSAFPVLTRRRPGTARCAQTSSAPPGRSQPSCRTDVATPRRQDFRRDSEAVALGARGAFKAPAAALQVRLAAARGLQCWPGICCCTRGRVPGLPQAQAVVGLWNPIGLGLCGRLGVRVPLNLQKHV